MLLGEVVTTETDGADGEVVALDYPSPRCPTPVPSEPRVSCLRECGGTRCPSRERQWSGLSTLPRGTRRQRKAGVEEVVPTLVTSGVTHSSMVSDRSVQQPRLAYARTPRRHHREGLSAAGDGPKYEECRGRRIHLHQHEQRLNRRGAPGRRARRRNLPR